LNSPLFASVRKSTTLAWEMRKRDYKLCLYKKRKEVMSSGRKSWITLFMTSLVLYCSSFVVLICSSHVCGSSRDSYGAFVFLQMTFFTGCYYLLKHYKNGEEIETNEPCLNCSCVNSMLMCYLRVCPYVRPLGDKCIIEKIAGECCPRITCPDGECHFSCCHKQGHYF
jgi:hypothetical protein